MRSLSQTQQNNILSLIDSNHSVRHIASITHVHPSTISRLRSKHRSTLQKSSGGRPAKLSPSDIRHATYLIHSQKAENAVQVTKALCSIKKTSIHPCTVRRYLHKSGMKAVVKKKRPILSAKHRRARLDFALAHKDWTLEDWKKVIWSDETKINRLGSDGRKWAWKRPGEGLSDRLVEGTLKFGGGSLMMWGCMTWDGPGIATRIDGRMNGELYLSILEEELQESIRFYGLEPTDIIFQQDNDPKHTCKRVKAWLEEQDFQTMDWPAQSPDLNPIEHLWSHLKRRLGEYQVPPSGMLELWGRVEMEWDRIPPSVCQELIKSMPKRIMAVIKAKGGYTKY
jgi:transposase